MSSFIEIEDRNFGMFRYIQLVNKDLKKEQAALDKVQSDVREFTEMNREAHEAKKKAMERRQRDAQRYEHHARAACPSSLTRVSMRAYPCPMVQIAQG